MEIQTLERTLPICPKHWVLDLLMTVSSFKMFFLILGRDG
jgi:hypothetical protein